MFHRLGNVIIHENTKITTLRGDTNGQMKNHCDCPLVFWDYCVKWRVLIYNVSVKDSFNLDGQNPHIVTTGEPADISNL